MTVAELPVEAVRRIQPVAQVDALRRSDELSLLLDAFAPLLAGQGGDLLALAYVDRSGDTRRLAFATGVFPAPWRERRPQLEVLARRAAAADAPFALAPTETFGPDENAPDPARRGVAFPYPNATSAAVCVVLLAGPRLRSGPEGAAQRRVLADAFYALAAPLLRPPRLGAQLTARQRACLGGAAEGRSSAEIGLRLGLASKTVDSYLAAAAARLGARNRTAAVSIALRLGLI